MAFFGNVTLFIVFIGYGINKVVLFIVTFLLDKLTIGVIFVSVVTASGFNLLNGNYAKQIGSTGVWYFAVPHLVYGSINNSAENKGVLFTDNNGNALTPTVYLKKISDGETA
ncbi:MAG: hypothetical protein J5626_11310, partial [Lachnospiraceae bacterium]|nr:hypothetical protein [Lachnospiraceae bacterium]